MAIPLFYHDPVWYTVTKPCYGTCGNNPFGAKTKPTRPLPV